MTINYNVTGTERKRLADYISGFMGTEKKYLGAPTFAYQIGYLTVSKDGAVSFEDRGCNSDIDALMCCIIAAPPVLPSSPRPKRKPSSRELKP